MKLLSKKLLKNDKLENRIRLICSYNYASCNFEQGRIINIDKTNISFIEPNRVFIKIDKYIILIIYFDKDNLFLYSRTMPITLKGIELLLKHIKNEVL